MRKLRRSVVNKLLAAALIVLFLFLLHVLSSENDLVKKEKIMIIERSINSPMNQGECHFPHLPVYNPEIMKFYQPVDKIDCGDALEDWVMCEKSICFVKPEISSKYGKVVCSYTDLIRKNDYKVKYGKTTKTEEPYVLQESDFVKVSCYAASLDKSWHGMAFGIRDNVLHSVKLNHVETEDPNSSLQYNILMWGFDSMSRNAYIRKLPKTYEYLTEKLGAIVLKGYNIVGDGTPQALVPLLTGFTELELPETRKRMQNAASVDVYPMLWHDYTQQGYITSFNEDLPNVGTFTYRLTGFEKQPVDHYLRTFYVEAENLWSESKKNCIGHQPDHKIMLEYTKQFMAKYKDKPSFIFSFHGGLSHDSINLIGAADDDVQQWLSELNDKKYLENTILIVMADHGNRFADVRATLQGKQEERLPFFSFVFPQSFKKRFPQEYKNFVENAERLATPFDVHATLKDILELQQSQIDQSANLDETENPPVEAHALSVANQRAISLFKTIPKNRSCADAYIELHWCACLNWQPIQLNDTSHSGLLNKLGASIVDTINNATHSHQQYCAHLELERINWAMRLRPHKELLHFKTNSDQDGFLADMSDNTKLPTMEIYQLQIVVKPGQSLFEASVSYNLQTFTAHTQLSEISRINKYGSQANCIYERNPELRKYCYCRDTAVVPNN